MPAQVAIHQNSVSLSLSGCDAAYGNDLSLLSNPANLGVARPTSASLFYENRYILKELSTKGLAVAYTGRYGTVGLMAANFGFDAFNTSRYGLAYARSFANQKVTAGFQLNLHDDFQTGAGHFTTLFSNVGVICQATQKIRFGVHCYNPEQATIGYAGYEMALPTYFELGVNWQVLSHTRVMAETEQWLDRSASFGVALESSVKDRLYCRGGYKITHNEFSWGIGANFGRLFVDSGFTYQMPLGLVSGVALKWDFSPTNH